MLWLWVIHLWNGLLEQSPHRSGRELLKNQIIGLNGTSEGQGNYLHSKGKIKEEGNDGQATIIEW